MTKPVRRWRFWTCYMGQHREKKAEEEIRSLNQQGFKARIWAPLPEHKTSGHIHISVLCTLEEKVKLGLGKL